MSRYVNYDALMDRLGICVKTGMGSTIAFTFKYIVDETPSIDIVRCGECKYAEHRADFDDYECHHSGCGLVYNADDFCSYGEVSEIPTDSEKPNNLERRKNDRDMERNKRL